MKKIRVKEVFKDASHLVMAIETIHTQKDRTDSSCTMSGLIQPVAIVVCNLEETYALDIEAQPTAVEPLRREIPELDFAIGSFHRRN